MTSSIIFPHTCTAALALVQWMRTEGNLIYRFISCARLFKMSDSFNVCMNCFKVKSPSSLIIFQWLNAFVCINYWANVKWNDTGLCDAAIWGAVIFMDAHVFRWCVRMIIITIKQKLKEYNSKCVICYVINIICYKQWMRTPSNQLRLSIGE